MDLDGTLVKHNGYLADGHDTLLKRAKEFVESIPKEDIIIILTSRNEEYKERTLSFLSENNIRYNYIIFGLPYGERVIVNDKKPSGLKVSLAVDLERDKGDYPDINIDDKM